MNSTQLRQMSDTWDDAWVEYSKSDQDKCRVCKATIERGSMRMGYGYWKTRWYHPRCFILAEDPFKHQRGLRYTLDYFRRRSYYFRSDKLTERDFDNLGKKLDEYHTKIAKLKLKKHIFEMKVHELKQELKQRHLLISGNKKLLQSRLRNYLQHHQWCIRQQRSQNEKLLAGYLRSHHKSCGVEIPKVLQDIILALFPQIIL